MDDKILDALAAVPMTGAEIGRGFAPEHLKDREGWGRKWLRKAAESGLVRAVADRWTSAEPVHSARVPPPDGFLNRAQVLLQSWLADAIPRDYRAPHANRPTPPTPHYSRYSRKPRYCNK